MQSKPESLYSLQNCTMYRRDREPHRGYGGVLVYMNCKLTRQCNVLTPTNSNNEELWVRIVPTTGPPFVVCCTYRLPRTDHAELLHNLDTSLCIVKAQYPQAQCVITGDFNGKNICWYENDLTKCERVKGMDIQTWISTHNMYQHVDFSTQEYSEQLQSCLDLVISNIENLHVLPHAPLGKSDHIVIEGKLPLTTNEPQHSTRKGVTWCWKQANVHGLI